MVNPLRMGPLPTKPSTLLREFDGSKTDDGGGGVNIPVATFLGNLGNLGNLVEQFRCQKATIVQQAQAYLVVRRSSSSGTDDGNVNVNNANGNANANEGMSSRNSSSEGNPAVDNDYDYDYNHDYDYEEEHESNGCWGNRRPSSPFSSTQPNSHPKPKTHKAHFGRRSHRHQQPDHNFGHEFAPLVPSHSADYDKENHTDYRSYRPHHNHNHNHYHNHYHNHNHNHNNHNHNNHIHNNNHSGKQKHRPKLRKEDSFNQSRGPNGIAKKLFKRLLRKKQPKKEKDADQHKNVDYDGMLHLHQQKELPHRIGNRTFKRKNDTKGNMYFGNNNTFYNESLGKNDDAHPHSIHSSRTDIYHSANKSGRDIHRRDKKKRKKRNRKHRVASEPQTHKRLTHEAESARQGCRPQKRSLLPKYASDDAPVSQNMSRGDPPPTLSPSSLPIPVTSFRKQILPPGPTPPSNESIEVELNPLNLTSPIPLPLPTIHTEDTSTEVVSHTETHTTDDAHHPKPTSVLRPPPTNIQSSHARQEIERITLNPKRLERHRSSFDQLDYDDILEAAKSVLSEEIPHPHPIFNPFKPTADTTLATDNATDDTPPLSTKCSSESHTSAQSIAEDIVLAISVKRRVQDIEHNVHSPEHNDLFDLDDDERGCIPGIPFSSSSMSSTTTTTTRPPQCAFDLFPKLFLRPDGTALEQRPSLAPPSAGDCASTASSDSDTEGEVRSRRIKVVLLGSGYTDGLSESLRRAPPPPRSSRSSYVEKRKNLMSKRRCPDDGINLSVDLWTPTVGVGEEEDRRCSSGHSSSGSSSGEDMSFSLWEMEGLAKDCHHATQSLLISPDSLYAIVYKIPPTPHTTITSHYPTNRLAQEDALLNSQRKLHRHMDRHFFSFVDLLSKHSPNNCAILPVVECEESISKERIRSVCQELKKRISEDGNVDVMVEEEVDELSWDDADVGRSTTSSSPRIVFHHDAFPRVFPSKVDGCKELRNAICHLAECGPVFHRHVNREITSVVGCVRKIVAGLRKDGHDVAHLDDVVTKAMGDCPDADRSEIIDALRFLSSVGDVVHFFSADEETTRPSEVNETVLSKFVVLDPRWLTDVVSCILREDWKDIRNDLNNTRHPQNSPILGGCARKYSSSCPILSAQDSITLWKSKKFILDTRGMIPKSCPDDLFLFLRQVCIHCGIFIPVSTTITGATTTSSSHNPLTTHYLLPGLCKRYPMRFWSSKSKENWKTTLCQAWLFKTRQPISMFDQVRIAVLDELNDIVDTTHPRTAPENTTLTKVTQLMCWKTALYAKLEEEITSTGIKHMVELFVRIVHSDSPHCPASHTLKKGIKLVVSARGDEAHHGEIIWKLGYGHVLDAIESVVKKAFGQDFDLEREVVCPKCLANSDPCKANVWKVEDDSVYDQCDPNMVCMDGHTVSAKMIYGSGDNDNEDETTVCTACTTNTACTSTSSVTPGSYFREDPPGKSIEKLLGGVVLVALWDTKEGRIIDVGTGFIADHMDGLILTAGHIFYDLQEGKRPGCQYKGYTDAKAIIGTMKKSKDGVDSDTAHFTYSAEIVCDNMINSVDAVVLRITSKFKKPFQCDSLDLKLQPDAPIYHGKFKCEKLKKLKLKRAYCEEQIRIIGINQSGEGRYERGTRVNHQASITKGYVCQNIDTLNPIVRRKNGVFSPYSEIVVECTAYEGQSGGPCVNQDGKVIGIVSRTNPIDSRRCYLVPWRELELILKMAKKRIRN